MQRKGSRLLGILSILFGLLFNHAVCLSQSPECLVTTMESFVGVREATGHNDGDTVEMFLAHVGMGKGYAWCAAIMTYVYDQCGIPNPHTAWSPSWGLDADAVYETGDGISEGIRHAQPGDAFTIYFPSKKRIAHVGMYIRGSPAHVETIEGNTNVAGSREGDGVYKKIRSWNQIYRITHYQKDS